MNQFEEERERNGRSKTTTTEKQTKEQTHKWKHNFKQTNGTTIWKWKNERAKELDNNNRKGRGKRKSVFLQGNKIYGLRHQKKDGVIKINLHQSYNNALYRTAHKWRHKVTHSYG